MLWEFVCGDFFLGTCVWGFVDGYGWSFMGICLWRFVRGGLVCGWLTKNHENSEQELKNDENNENSTK